VLLEIASDGGDFEGWIFVCDGGRGGSQHAWVDVEGHESAQGTDIMQRLKQRPGFRRCAAT